jgi:hypothetical protein
MGMRNGAVGSLQQQTQMQQHGSGYDFKVDGDYQQELTCLECSRSKKQCMSRYLSTTGMRNGAVGSLQQQTQMQQQTQWIESS